MTMKTTKTVSNLKQQMLEAVPVWLRSPALPTPEDPALYVYADHMGYLYIGPDPILKGGVRVPRIKPPENSPYPLKLEEYRRIPIPPGVDWRILVVKIPVTEKQG